MGTFVYNPEGVKTWSNELLRVIDGDGNSIASCLKEMSNSISELVQPNVWTGDAAFQNYNNFMTTYNTLADFSKKFGLAFAETMEEVATQVAGLERNNLGVETNVDPLFGENGLTLNEISQMAESTINKEIVTYNYDAILRIGETLAKIKSTLDDVHSNLNATINKLGDDSIWAGNAAETAKSSLLQTINDHLPEIYANLDTCISNIKMAAEAASMADTGK